MYNLMHYHPSDKEPTILEQRQLFKDIKADLLYYANQRRGLKWQFHTARKYVNSFTGEAFYIEKA